MECFFRFFPPFRVQPKTQALSFTNSRFISLFIPSPPVKRAPSLDSHRTSGDCRVGWRDEFEFGELDDN